MKTRTVIEWVSGVYSPETESLKLISIMEDGIKRTSIGFISDDCKVCKGTGVKEWRKV